MKSYTINNYKDEIPWDIIQSLEIDQFPWYECGQKQKTFVKIALKNKSLFLKVKALDEHSSAKILEENGSVYLDSCFEFFLTPENQLSENYINFEINCVGNLYLAVRNSSGKRRANTRELEQVKIMTSLPYKKIKEPLASDEFWTLDIEIPLQFIEEFYGNTIDMDFWHGNFYRIGGQIDDQYATWSPVKTEKPDFHQPLQFNKIAINNQIIK